jgi:hypothetical protein
MARDSSGTYTPNPASPMVTGTPIASSVANQRAADLATELTDSLSRSGKGGMLAPLVFTGITATMRGGAADGGSAVGTVLDNSVTLANSSAKLVSIRNNTVEKASIDKDGGAAFAGTVAAPTFWSAQGGLGLSVKGRAADGASAVGVVLDNSNSLADAGAKLVSIRNNTVEKAYFDKDGKLFVAGTQVAPAPVLTDTPVAGSGWTVTAHSVKKNADGLVTCHLKLAAGASPAAFQGAQLSAGFRPPVNSTIIWWNDTDGTETSGTLNSTGWVAPPNTANKTFSIHVSFYAA